MSLISPNGINKKLIICIYKYDMDYVCIFEVT